MSQSNEDIACVADTLEIHPCDCPQPIDLSSGDRTSPTTKIKREGCRRIYWVPSLLGALSTALKVPVQGLNLGNTLCGRVITGFQMQWSHFVLGIFYEKRVQLCLYIIQHYLFMVYKLCLGFVCNTNINPIQQAKQLTMWIRQRLLQFSANNLMLEKNIRNYLCSYNNKLTQVGI